MQGPWSSCLAAVCALQLASFIMVLHVIASGRAGELPARALVIMPCCNECVARSFARHCVASFFVIPEAAQANWVQNAWSSATLHPKFFQTRPRAVESRSFADMSSNVDAVRAAVLSMSANTNADAPSTLPAASIDWNLIIQAGNTPPAVPWNRLPVRHAVYETPPRNAAVHDPSPGSGEPSSLRTSTHAGTPGTASAEKKLQEETESVEEFVASDVEPEKLESKNETETQNPKPNHPKPKTTSKARAKSKPKATSKPKAKGKAKGKPGPKAKAKRHGEAEHADVICTGLERPAEEEISDEPATKKAAKQGGPMKRPAGRKQVYNASEISSSGTWKVYLMTKPGSSKSFKKYKNNETNRMFRTVHEAKEAGYPGNA